MEQSLLGCNQLVGLAVHKSSVLRQKGQGVRRLSDCPQNSDLNIYSPHHQWLIVGQAFDSTGHALSTGAPFLSTAE